MKKFGGEHLGDPLEMEAEGEGKLQQVVCCRVGDETEGLDEFGGEDEKMKTCS